MLTTHKRRDRLRNMLFDVMGGDPEHDVGDAEDDLDQILISAAPHVPVTDIAHALHRTHDVPQIEAFQYVLNTLLRSL